MAVIALFSASPCTAQWHEEARTPDGIVVLEECYSYPPARLRTPCGTAARKAADVITRLGLLLGPLPQKKLQLGLAFLFDRAQQNYIDSVPGRIRITPDLYPYLDTAIVRPDLLPRVVARQWIEPYYPPQGSSPHRLAEALAEYLAWRYLNVADPEAARALVTEAMRDAPQWEPDGPPWPARKGFPDAISPELVAIRQHGLLVLRTLETVIDRERVDRVLPLLIRRSGKNPLSVALLESVSEEIAGRKLKWFFDYFVNGTEIPTIELRRLTSETTGVTAGEILVKGLPPEGSVRVEMTVRTAQGTVEHSVATHGAVTPFTVNVPAPALGITLDPDLRILRWTEAARRSKAQSEVLVALPEPIARKNLSAVELYRRALAADPDDASLRAQALHERLGELEWAHDEWDAALADLEAAINGHSISPFETYLSRAKAYLYHGVVQLHEGRPLLAHQDARAGLALPRPVLLQCVPREPIESHGDWTLEQLLDTLSDAASRY
jgi:tetratricopeptide (TPR) repeat protein